MLYERGAHEYEIKPLCTLIMAARVDSRPLITRGINLVIRKHAGQRQLIYVLLCQ